MEQQERSMRLSITSTTGGPLELSVPPEETVDGLRTRISQRLRLPRNRTVLLYKDRQLTVGKLLDVGVTDGSKLTLVPVIEAGLVFSNARAERTMMDVLESLSENQINDFLSGHSPLTINLGIGAHVMYVQLQLSAQDVKKLQEDRDRSSGNLQTGLLTDAGVNHFSSDLTATTTSSSTDSSVPTSSSQHSTQRPFNATSTSVPLVKRQNNSPLPQSRVSGHTSPSGCPRSFCTLQAAAPVSSPAPSGFSPGPPSPRAASTFEKSNVHASAPTERCAQTGAVIESFVRHSPGVFSGTFSGTLSPNNQIGVSHPRRRGMSIILQILSDLLRAASYHQRAPSSLSQHHCPALNCPVSPVLPGEESSKIRSEPAVMELSKSADEATNPVSSPTDEAQTLHCKLERLQSMMHQRRFHKRARRSSRLSQMSHPYQRHQHHL